MIKEYLHTETEHERMRKGEFSPQAIGVSTTDFETTIEYNGKKVLGLQCHTTKGIPYVIIPGYILRNRFKKTEHGLDISEIELILREDRRDIIELLGKQKLNGKIDFWSEYIGDNE